MQKWLLELEKFWRTLEKLPFNPSFLFFFWIPWTGICACLVMQEFRHAMPLSFQFFWCVTREEKRKMIILTGSLCVKYLFRYIQSCSALAGQGLYEGLAWLANNIANKATWCKNMTLCETIILWHNSHCICIYIYIMVDASLELQCKFSSAALIGRGWWSIILVNLVICEIAVLFFTLRRGEEALFICGCVEYNGGSCYWIHFPFQRWKKCLWCFAPLFKKHFFVKIKDFLRK